MTNDINRTRLAKAVPFVWCGMDEVIKELEGGASYASVLDLLISCHKLASNLLFEAKTMRQQEKAAKLMTDIFEYIKYYCTMTGAQVLYGEDSIKVMRYPRC